MKQRNGNSANISFFIYTLQRAGGEVSNGAGPDAIWNTVVSILPKQGAPMQVSGATP
jgi:hypothetical protein